MVFQSVFAPLYYRASVEELEPLFDELKEQLLYIADEDVPQSWTPLATVSAPEAFNDHVMLRWLTTQQVLMLIRQLAYNMYHAKRSSERHALEQAT